MIDVAEVIRNLPANIGFAESRIDANSKWYVVGYSNIQNENEYRTVLVSGVVHEEAQRIAGEINQHIAAVKRLTSSGS